MIIQIDEIEKAYKSALSKADGYRAEISAMSFYEKQSTDSRLEMWISHAVRKGDLKSVGELVKLRRPIAVGKMEGLRIIATNPDEHEFCDCVGRAIENHATKYWSGVTT